MCLDLVPGTALETARGRPLRLQPWPTLTWLGAAPGCTHRRQQACRGCQCPAATAACWLLGCSLASSDGQLDVSTGCPISHTWPCSTPPALHLRTLGPYSQPPIPPPVSPCPHTGSSNPIQQESRHPSTLPGNLQVQRGSCHCSPPGEAATLEWHL